MSAEDEHAEAERRIAEAKARGATELDLSDLHALTVLPPDISTFTALRTLSLTGTQVTDIAPLQNLSALQILDLSGTKVKDLRPVADFSFEMLRKISSLGRTFRGLNFFSTPAAKATPELTALAQIKGNEERTQKTLAYLRSLPPWPEPWDPLQDLDAVSVPPQPSPQVATTTAHIAFILRTAKSSDAVARVATEQIRAALNDVPIPQGSNRLPEELQVFQDMAEIFARLTTPLSEPDSPNAETALRDRIAELERSIAALTAQLADETRRAETAEAALSANPNWALYKASLAPKAADLTIWLTKAGVIYRALHFLGTSDPVMVRMLDLLAKI